MACFLPTTNQKQKPEDEAAEAFKIYLRKPLAALKDYPAWQLIKLYLVLAFAYYEKDEPLAPDDFFDGLSKEILSRKHKIPNLLSGLIPSFTVTISDLEAGTYLGKYSTETHNIYRRMITK